MESQTQPKSIRWAPQLPKATVNDRRSGANAAGPAIVSSSSRAQADTHGTQDPLGYNSTVSSPSLGKHHSDYLVDETGYSGQGRAGDSGQAATLCKATPSAPSTAPSTDTASNTHTTVSSTSPPNSIYEDDDLDGNSCAVKTQPTADLASSIELMEICPGTFVAVTQEPGNEAKLQWRALSMRIRIALAKTCRRYPNLSVQFKLAGSSAGSLKPVILFVCPPDTQKQVRKFVKKQKWLSEGECGYKNLIVDGNFLRVALDGEGGLDGGLFIRTDMGGAQTLCAKLGRLEGTLSPTGEGSRFTIGGVVVVNDTFCCLTTGHVLFDAPDTSEIADFVDDEETDEEDVGTHAADTEHSAPPSQPSFDPLDQHNDDDGDARSQESNETRIGRLLTTSNWKRGVLASNEDWSLIRLDAACCTDEWIVNRFCYPGTEIQEPLQITIDKLARTEAEMTETEVTILAGCSGLQKGQLNTTAVQLYLDNATFDAREIVTHEPLRMGDSGSWVVHGSKLLGHVFAIQEGTSCSYMIPITQVLEDIQKSLLTYSIELPIQTNQAKVSLICLKNRRSHASLVAFGVNACPHCGQDLSSHEHAQEKGLPPKSTDAVDRGSFYNDEDSYSSPSDSNAYSDQSDPFKASTVPTSYYATYGNHGLDDKDNKFVPLAGETVPFDEYCRIPLPKAYSGRNSPYIALEAGLDEVQPRKSNMTLIGRIRTDASVVLDLANPINENVRATRITLLTSSLNSALRHVVRWDRSINQRFRQIVINEPYGVLVRHFHELTVYASELRGAHIAGKSMFRGPGTGKQSTSSQTRDHPQHEDVQALIDFTQGVIHAADVATEFSRHERNSCIFSKLWLLFHPGMTVYAYEMDSRALNAYVLSSLDLERSILRPSWQNREPYVVHMWRLQYDGVYVAKQRFSVAISYFEGERDITSLKVFPCEYLDKTDGGKTRRELEDRGRRWYQLLRGGGATHYIGRLSAKPDLHYEGPLVVDRGGVRDGRLELNNTMLLPFENEPDVVYKREKAVEPLELDEASLPGYPWTSYGPLDPGKTEDLELRDDEAGTNGHRYLLCASYLPGFLVEQKEWAWIDVNCCFPPKTNHHALDHLLLPSSTEDIIRILVQDFKQPVASALQQSEQGKRSGTRTILLHGSSGTGKRYTAECLAEAEGKILMTIHPGEIGRDPQRARHLLSMWLRLAQISDAIVLVPAADSFVQRPTAVGYRREMSSVFWECLEAYRGVVILTTSRSVEFDEVALSRITFPIHYADFDSDTRRQIGWQEMRRLQREREYFTIGLEARVLWESTLREVDWNGHEIKSVLENALAMARNRNRTGRKKPQPHMKVSDEESDSLFLTGEDLRAVIESKKTFDKYVKEG